MQLTIIGNRAGMPASGRPSSGYVVQTAGATILLDCGPGVATALDGWIDPADLDAIAVSHMHSDHCYDLLVLGKQLTSIRLRGDAGSPQVSLYVPEGAADTLRAINKLLPTVTIPPLDRVFDDAITTTEYTPGTPVNVRDCVIRPVAMRHAVPCCGFRIDTPAGSLAYSGDTGPTDALTELAAGVDLFLCEASLTEPDTTGHGHLTAAEAGAAAAAAGARHLVLTHFPQDDPDWLAAQTTAAARAFPGPISLATPGARFTPPANGGVRAGWPGAGGGRRPSR